jgi:hypothetical protein
MTWSRRLPDGSLRPFLGDWLRGRRELDRLRAQGLRMAHATADELAMLGHSLAEEEDQDLAHALAQVKERNLVRRRVLERGGPVTQLELEQDASYWRLYTLPEGCLVDWANGQRTVVVQDQDRKRHQPLGLTLDQPLPQDLAQPAPEPHDGAQHLDGSDAGPATGPGDPGSAARGAGETKPDNRLEKVKRKILSEDRDRIDFGDEER